MKGKTMFPENYFKQIISFQKATFDNSFTAVSLLQEQTERMLQTFLTQIPGMPEEGKTIVNHWFGAMREGRETWRRFVDENLEKAAESLEPRMQEPAEEEGYEEPGKECRLNQASRKEISQLVGIGDATAEKIVSYRDENGPFQDWEELQKIPGIKPTIVARLQEECRL